jgi:hypothetical protein
MALWFPFVASAQYVGKRYDKNDFNIAVLKTRLKKYGVGNWLHKDNYILDAWRKIMEDRLLDDHVMTWGEREGMDRLRKALELLPDVAKKCYRDPFDENGYEPSSFRVDHRCINAMGYPAESFWLPGYRVRCPWTESQGEEGCK